jgi:phenylacetate-CoA ligase
MARAQLSKDRKRFLETDVRELSRKFSKGDGSAILRQGAKAALALFQRAAKEVPAYKDFLATHGVNAKKIKSTDDFVHVPVMQKATYLRQYPLKDLVFPGTAGTLHTLSASSGSTGKPYLWPRGEAHELEGALIHETIFNQFFGVGKRSRALAIVCFSMGTWIAGTYTLASIKELAAKGYDVQVITPGIDKQTLFDVLGDLLPRYETIILAGYPPYIKDVLDEGAKGGIVWKNNQMRLLLAGEGISEEFRDYLAKQAGISDAGRNIITLYGTADAAIVAHETPISNFIREVANHRAAARQALFLDERLPSVGQFNPKDKYIEALGRSIIFTTDWGIPLIRYGIGDEGGVLPYAAARDLLEETVPGALKKFQHPGLHWKLPFVYLFGRSDLTASLYAVLIYPEHIKAGLRARSVASKLTGKFVMSTEYRKSQDQYLLIRLELAKGVKPTPALAEAVQKAVMKALQRRNIEFRKLHSSLGDRVLPEVQLLAHGDTKYFALGNKQRWVA